MKKSVVIGTVIVIVVSIILMAYYINKVRISEPDLPPYADIPTFMEIGAGINPVSPVLVEESQVPASSLVQRGSSEGGSGQGGQGNSPPKQKGRIKVMYYDPIMDSYIQFKSQELNTEIDDTALILYLSVNKIPCKVKVNKNSNKQYATGTENVGTLTTLNNNQEIPLVSVEAKGKGIQVKFVVETKPVVLYISGTHDFGKKLRLYVGK